jgi:hypothetical protein
VFCASLADVFDNAVDPAWCRDSFPLIAATPHPDWLLLTKRIGNARRMIAEATGCVQWKFILRAAVDYAAAQLSCRFGTGRARRQYGRGPQGLSHRTSTMSMRIRSTGPSDGSIDRNRTLAGTASSFGMSRSASSWLTIVAPSQTFGHGDALVHSGIVGPRNSTAAHRRSISVVPSMSEYQLQPVFHPPY